MQLALNFAHDPTIAVTNPGKSNMFDIHRGVGGRRIAVESGCGSLRLSTTRL